jgi:hypothetical protein
MVNITFRLEAWDAVCFDHQLWQTNLQGSAQADIEIRSIANIRLTFLHVNMCQYAQMHVSNMRTPVGTCD